MQFFVRVGHDATTKAIAIAREENFLRCEMIMSGGRMRGVVTSAASLAIVRSQIHFP